MTCGHLLKQRATGSTDVQMCECGEHYSTIVWDTSPWWKTMRGHADHGPLVAVVRELVRAE